MGSRLTVRAAGALVVLATSAVVVAVAALVSGREGPGTPRAPGVLTAIGADYFSATRAGGGRTYTSIPVTFRNRSTRPVFVRSVSIEHATNLKVEKTFMIGPQSPSRTFNIYNNWPPSNIDDLGRGPLDPQAVDGFTIAPNLDGPDEVVAPYQTAEGRKLVTDQLNDASPVFVVRAIDPRLDASATGITISYDVDGRAVTQRFESVSFHLCAPTGAPTGTCTRS